MNDTTPRFELARVFADGTGEVPQIVPVTAIPATTEMSRRGFLGATKVLGAGASAAVVVGPSTVSSAAQPVSLSNCGDEILAHGKAVTAVAFCPDGKFLASGSVDGTFKLWSMPGGALRATRQVGAFDVASTYVAFSPDAKWLATASARSIKLWSVPGCDLGTTLPEHDLFATAIVLSPDGKLLASGYEKTIKLWSIPRGDLNATLSGQTDRVRSLAFSPDGKLLASGSDDKTIKLWSIPHGDLTVTLSGHTDSVSSVAFSPDGKRLASGSSDHTVKWWSIPNGHFERVLVGHKLSVQSVTFSPDGKWLASASNDLTIKMWSMPGGVLSATLVAERLGVYSIAFSPDGRWLASASGEGTIRIRPVPPGGSAMCLFDRSLLASNQQVRQYTDHTETGQIVTYTMPCGSPIPAGATCLCNCVAGTAPASVTPLPAAPAYSPPALSKPPVFSTPGGSYKTCSCNQVCTCDKVCVCIPVCQAHRLCDPDPVIRRMAEELVSRIVPCDPEYLKWAASTAPAAIGDRIDYLRRIAIYSNNKLVGSWPTLDTCRRYLGSRDEVVSIMAAQVIYIAYGAHEQDDTRQVSRLLDRARQLHWRTRASVVIRHRVRLRARRRAGSFGVPLRVLLEFAGASSGSARYPIAWPDP